MIVEPVPTSPRSPGGRVLRLAGVSLPPLLLVGIVAAGAFGPRPATVSPPDAPPSVGRAAETASPEATARREQAPVLARTPVAFPATVLGLPVGTAAQTLALRAAGGARGVVAVSGYLSLGEVSPTCLDGLLDAPSDGCAVWGVIADQPVAPVGANGTGFAGLGPHLHPQFAPGTRAPARDQTPGSQNAEPIPIVALGMFEYPNLDPCSPGGRDCSHGFVILRVGWVAGEPWSATLIMDPALLVDPSIREIRASIREATARLGGAAITLATAVVRPAALHAIDADAARSLPPIPADRRLRPVTFVRGLFLEPDPGGGPGAGAPAGIGWIVLDSISGEVLARGGVDPHALPVDAAP